MQVVNEVLVSIYTKLGLTQLCRIYVIYICTWYYSVLFKS